MQPFLYLVSYSFLMSNLSVCFAGIVFFWLALLLCFGRFIFLNMELARFHVISDIMYFAFPVCKALSLDGGLSFSRYDRNAGWMRL